MIGGVAPWGAAFGLAEYCGDMPDEIVPDEIMPDEIPTLAERSEAIADLPPSEAEIEDFSSSVLAKLALAVGKDAEAATARDWFVATALALRDRVLHIWLSVDRASHAEGRKHVYYLSLEFLIGRLFADVVGSLRLTETVTAALGDLGVDLDRLRRAEPDAALGNGGLGRLAACLMESMASLGIPACGYGIRYDHGLFRQVIRNGWQQEYAEDWLSFGNPWEFARPEVVYDVHYGGRVEMVAARGRMRPVWHPDETIEAVAYDTPVVGWRGRHVNPLRLWSARAPDPLRLDVFNNGDHVGALFEQSRAEALSKILYPGDNTPAGRELRLRQEYFFVSASLQDIVRRHLQYYGDLLTLPERVAIQLNDTHPSIAIAELMRLLLDTYGLPWDAAWQVTVGTFAYTNHTLLPEALETWPVALIERVLPRHLDVIYRINAQHLETAMARGLTDGGVRAALSIIDEHGGRSVRMGHLAFVGSHRVNGVSALHTKLMRESVFAELHRLYPERIVNKTNGITFRRWLFQANPALTRLLVDVCGAAVLDNPAALERLADHADDGEVLRRLAAVKRANKTALIRLIHEQAGFLVSPDALFDVHIKRIHEYKRQLLNLLDAVARWHAIRDDPDANWVPRVKVFAGKAAAGYAQAKLIIKLANDIAQVINDDPLMRGRLRLVFLPNYNVSLAETIIPAADLSEQISTAGMEASGTGNMKLALNGALTIGTLDGANIEIRERVGAENIFIFGMTAAEVAARRERSLDAGEAIAASPDLARAIAAIGDGAFSPDDHGRFRHIADGLRYIDRYMTAADFDAYREAQAKVDEFWRRPAAWARAAALNIANMAWFSADRTIAEYAADIWQVPLRFR
jgi:starch phosphorylase